MNHSHHCSNTVVDVGTLKLTKNSLFTLKSQSYAGLKFKTAKKRSETPSNPSATNLKLPQHNLFNSKSSQMNLHNQAPPYNQESL